MAFQERPESHLRSPQTTRFERRGLVPLSVLIPLQSGPKALLETVDACCRLAGACELEFVVVHDGELNGSCQQLQDQIAGRPNVSVRLIENGGADPRNVGADAAMYDHVLFLDDDLRPADESFFLVHSSLHSSRSEKNFVVLGDVGWPGRAEKQIVYSLGRYLRPRRLGDFPPLPQSLLDYRYFSSANSSMRKSLVRDWMNDGFCSDLPYPLSDLELAYRTSKQTNLRVFYDPAALACRARWHGLHALLEQQVFIGSQLRLLFQRHPEAAREFDMESILDATSSANHSDPSLPANYATILEGLKAWARIVDDRIDFEGEPCRAGLLFPVLEACLLEGLARSYSNGEMTANLGGAILGRFTKSIGRTFHSIRVDASSVNALT